VPGFTEIQISEIECYGDSNTLDTTRVCGSREGFSRARRTCAWYRLRLSCSTIELIECVGSWLRQGLIKPSDQNLGLSLNFIDDEVIPGLTDEVVDEIQWFELE
jgi:hypothetical protein